MKHPRRSRAIGRRAFIKSESGPRPNVPIAELTALFFKDVLLFRVNETPDFVGLNPPGIQIAQVLVLILRARISRI